MDSSKLQVNIVGAGLAGLSAAITLARLEVPCRLFSLLPSERAQSVLAEGGINGALNTMGEGDCPENHFNDTMQAGAGIADPEAVKGLTDHAPEILLELKSLGAAFNLEHEQIQQRSFGGQKKKRTAYARSSTGKILMTTLIDEARKYEAAGLISRYSHHDLADILVSEDNDFAVSEPESSEAFCQGIIVRDTYTDELLQFTGPVILATGGLNGFFPELTTGTVTNSGDASALAFARGVRFSNLEMIQYHPTTIGIAGKRCLVSEAARGEGGRLFVLRNGKPWYFMEEKYPELRNLMPRDVVSREMFFVVREEVYNASGGACGGKGAISRTQEKSEEYNAAAAAANRASQGEAWTADTEANRVSQGKAWTADTEANRVSQREALAAGIREHQVYLDMRHLPKETWKKNLPDLRSEIMHYLGIDPAKKPIPVEPGIHYFMGGIDVDVRHRTNIRGLYAAGECCSQYHGANRLGGNSTVGAIYGGKIAAKTAAEELGEELLAYRRILSGKNTPCESDIDEKVETENHEACETVKEDSWYADKLSGRDNQGSCEKYRSEMTEAADGRKSLKRTKREDLTITPSRELICAIRNILSEAMGIVRNEGSLQTALDQLKQLAADREHNLQEQNRLMLAEAMLRSALVRKESRGAHYRSDYPETLEWMQSATLACLVEQKMTVDL